MKTYKEKAAELRAEAAKAVKEAGEDGEIAFHVRAKQFRALEASEAENDIKFLDVKLAREKARLIAQIDKIYLNGKAAEEHRKDFDKRFSNLEQRQRVIDEPPSSRQS